MISASEYLDLVGFAHTGAGALFFLFIQALIVESSLIIGAFGEYGCHTLEVKGYWLKNIKNHSNDRQILEVKGDLDKSDWTRKKKISFWCVDKGNALSFELVAVGFLYQLSAKFF